ncbi:MAG: hemoglobin [Candidatus Poriferisodalaceae bacterium]
MSEQVNMSLYELVGGEQWFVDLVNRFYDGIDTDPLVRPMYPDDLTGSRHWMALFLVQYWGGPTTYNENRGHPRLRMRHNPFPITQAARDAWFGHMRASLEVSGLDPDVEAQVLAYFENAADHLINS